jgi:hypothetical protein
MILTEPHECTFLGDKGIGLRRIMVHGCTTTLNSRDRNTCVAFVCTIQHHCIECSHNKAPHSKLLFLITCNPSGCTFTHSSRYYGCGLFQGRQNQQSWSTTEVTGPSRHKHLFVACKLLFLASPFGSDRKACCLDRRARQTRFSLERGADSFPCRRYRIVADNQWLHCLFSTRQYIP